MLLNSSTEPVYGLRVTFYKGSEVRGSVTHRVLPPGEHGFIGGPELVTTGEDRYGDQVTDERYEDFLVQIDFRDSVGKLWTRSRHGYLVPRDNEGPAVD